MGTINSVQTNAPGASISGTVFGGQNPIVGADIYVVAAGVDVTGLVSSYGIAGSTLAHTTTDSKGNFTFASTPYTCPQSNTPVYLLSVGGDPGIGSANPNAVLAAPLGSCGSAQSSHLVMNEITTIATAFALKNYFTTSIGSHAGTANTYDTFGGPGSISGGTITYSKGLVLGDTYTSQLMAYNSNGLAAVSSGVLTTEPLKIYSLANILGSCVNSGGVTGAGDTTSACAQLFALTNADGTPTDTLQAAVEIARHPTLNVSSLFTLPGTHVAFEADLSSAPADWSVAVSYTSPNLGLGVDDNTVSTIDIDQNNRVWFPSNVGTSRDQTGDVQTMGQFHPMGAPIDYSGAAYFDPTSSAFFGPYNPGVSLVHPEQVAIDKNGYAWFSDTYSNAIVGIDTNSPATSTTVTLPNTQSFAVTIGTNSTSSSVVKVGLYDSTSGSAGYWFATVDPSVPSYTEDTQPSGGLPGRPVSLASNANTSGNYFALLSDGSNGLTYSTYDDGVTLNASPTLTPNATSTALPGQVSFNGTDLFGLRGYPGSGSNADGYCFAGNSTGAGCYNFTGTAAQDVPAGLAVDGAGTAWTANQADGTIRYTPFAAGSSYLNSGSIATFELNHNASHGGTALNPEGIAIDGEGNVWVSNAGCVGGGGGDITSVCSPAVFVLTQYIGAAAPTITPVSGQITSGNRAGTLPTY